MVKSNSPSPPFCIHSVFFPRGNHFHQFFAYCSAHMLCISKHACVVGEDGAYYTDCSAPGFCCFTVYLRELSVSLPTELPHSFEKLRYSSL